MWLQCLLIFLKKQKILSIHSEKILLIHKSNCNFNLPVQMVTLHFLALISVVLILITKENQTTQLANIAGDSAHDFGKIQSYNGLQVHNQKVQSN